MKKIFIFLLAVAMISFPSCRREHGDKSDESNATSDTQDISNGFYDEDQNISIYPNVKCMKSKKQQVTLEKIAVITDETTDSNALDELKALLKARKIEVSDSAEIKIYLGANNTISPEGEGYYINTSDENIILSSSGASGQYYAVITLGSLLDGKQLDMVEISDSPDVPVRGVIEGFYGEPWSHEDRLSIIEFCGQHKMNTYVYAPKDDAKHREKWRELYTDNEKIKMSELINCANKNCVDFVYAISPGLDINYGTNYESDKATLIAKCESMYKLGVRNFALLLDDIPSRTAKDANNHAMLVNDFRNEFYAMHSDLAALVCVFTEYFDNYITEKYTYTLAKKLNDKVIIIWTGVSVSSLKMTKTTFNLPNSIYNRKMMVWYNYPVNDYVENNLFTDGVRELFPNLKDSISGFVSNSMNQAEASKIPLFTIADYLWNTSAYNHDESYEAAIKQLHPDTAESVKMISKNTCSFMFNNYTDSVIFSKLLKDFENEYKKGIIGDATDELYSEFVKFKNSVKDIRTNDKNVKFIKEISPWLDKAELISDMGICFIDTLKTDDDKSYWESCRKFFDIKKQCDLNKANVSGAVLQSFFSSRAQSILSQRKFVVASSSDNVTITTNSPQYMDYKPELAVDNNMNTYFWSSCTPSQVSGGASFTLDAGEITEINSIYVAMGANSSDTDRFQSACLEISNDNSNWTTLYEGNVGEYTILDELSVNARYVRFRCTDNNSQYWFKLREFAINKDLSKTGTVTVTVSNSEATPSASLECYQEYDISNITDGDENTYYWSNGAADKGFNIKLDLGKKTNVRNIVLKSGNSPSGADYIYNGLMQYSNDGKTWTNIGGAYTTKNIIVSGINIDCRYIRYISNSVQGYWMSVSEFVVNVTVTSDIVFGEPIGDFKCEAAKMVDRDFTTYYKSLSVPKEGSRMTFEIPDEDISKIVVLQSSLCGADVIMIVDGAETKLGTLDEYYNAFDIPKDVSVDNIVVKWNGSIVPVINEVMFGK